MNDDFKYILLEIRSRLIHLKQKCSFPVFNTKTNVWEMKSGRIIIYGYESCSELILESKFNGSAWGKVIACKPKIFARHNLENIAVQLLIGIDDKKYS